MIFSNFNLVLNQDVNTFVFNEQEVSVLKYVPIEDKNDIIQMALQNSEENGIYNLLKIDMFFELYIIYLYTNIEFSDEDKENPTAIYNKLKSNGLIDIIMNCMENSELEYLRNKMRETLDNKMKYKNTVAAVLNSFIENLPIKATEAKNIIEKFNPEDFMQVLNFARSANGGRDIN